MKYALIIATILVLGLGFIVIQNEQELANKKGQIEQLQLAAGTAEQDAKRANQCHNQAERLMIEATELVGDLWDYGDDDKFILDVQNYLKNFEFYQDKCLIDQTQRLET